MTEYNGHEEMHKALGPQADRALCGLPDIPVRLLALRDTQVECKACLRILAQEPDPDA